MQPTRRKKLVSGLRRSVETRGRSRARSVDRAVPRARLRNVDTDPFSRHFVRMSEIRRRRSRILGVSRLRNRGRN
jgi:hypothetical protein